MPGAPSLPSADEVRSYLETHPLQKVLESATNDAVKRLVDDPFQHVAMICLEQSGKHGALVQKTKAREMRRQLAEREAAQKEAAAQRIRTVSEAQATTCLLYTSPSPRDS